MIVKELVEKLLTMPQESEVLFAFISVDRKDDCTFEIHDVQSHILETDGKLEEEKTVIMIHVATQPTLCYSIVPSMN